VSRNWKGGSTWRWRKIREYVLERDGHRCRAHADGWCDAVPRRHKCEGDGSAVVTHAHHVHGRAATGDDSRFIVASCASCNLHIGDPAARQPASSPRHRRVSRW